MFSSGSDGINCRHGDIEIRMINQELYETILFDTICRASTVISIDVQEAFNQAINREKIPHALSGLTNTYESIKLSSINHKPACPDTGWPMFYFKIGNECDLEGGMIALEKSARNAVIDATNLGYLRKTMKHPLTGNDPGNNIGMNIPYFSYKFIPGDQIDLTFVPKGGGSECFGGARSTVIAFADGKEGILKFIIDSYISATKAGAICPPSVVGIGIGGTANIAANLAKEASCLRLVGTKHPEVAIAEMEEKLYFALNSLGIGIMGLGGKTSVFAVNIEYAYTHLAGIACAMSCNCMIARRATTRIHADMSFEILNNPEWFDGR